MNRWIDLEFYYSNVLDCVKYIEYISLNSFHIFCFRYLKLFLATPPNYPDNPYLLSERYGLRGVRLYRYLIDPYTISGSNCCTRISEFALIDRICRFGGIFFRFHFPSHFTHCMTSSKNIWKIIGQEW